MQELYHCRLHLTFHDPNSQYSTRVGSDSATEIELREEMMSKNSLEAVIEKEEKEYQVEEEGETNIEQQ